MSKKGSPTKQPQSPEKLPQAEEPKLVDQSPSRQEPPRSPLDQSLSPDQQSPSHFDKSQNDENQNEEEYIPTDKDELIEFLKFKLMKSQNTIHETFEVFMEQKEATGKLVAEFDTKRREFNSIQKDTNRPLREKIHEKIEKALEKAVGEKVEAENKRNELRAAIEEKQMMKRELASTLRLLQAENEQKEKELDTLLTKNNEFETLIAELSTTKTNSENEGVEKSNEIVRLREEKHDMRGVMRKLSDVKHVLNRLFSNPDLLYTKEKTLEGLSKELLPTIKKDMTSPLPQAPTSKLGPAPINKPKYLVNEDDFWYADNPLEDYARDYGGREHNYNEKYNYNAKLQNRPQNNENINTEQPRYSSPTATLPQISGGKPQSGYKKQPANL